MMTKKELRAYVFANSRPIEEKPGSAPELKKEKARGYKAGAPPTLQLVLDMGRGVIEALDANGFPAAVTMFWACVQALQHMKAYTDGLDLEKAREVIQGLLEMLGERGHGLSAVEWSRMTREWR